MPDLIGKQLGQYELREKIGQGGMAQVYKASQPALDRLVALKILSPALSEAPGFTERFQHEARTVAGLNHPHILPVYDYGCQEPYHYLVMRYIPDSTTLNTLLRQNLPGDKLLHYLIQVAEALHYAHAQGLIHRDVKPANILIEGQTALLADFGLVKDKNGDNQLSNPGSAPGTPAYMSPEQARGEPVARQTDIYALGVILYKGLTNTLPPDTLASFTPLVNSLAGPGSALHPIKPDLPASLVQVTLRALAREPEARYPTAMHFAEALQQARQELTS